MTTFVDMQYWHSVVLVFLYKLVWGRYKFGKKYQKIWDFYSKMPMRSVITILSLSALREYDSINYC